MGILQPCALGWRTLPGESLKARFFWASFVQYRLGLSISRQAGRWLQLNYRRWRVKMEEGTDGDDVQWRLSITAVSNFYKKCFFHLSPCCASIIWNIYEKINPLLLILELLYEKMHHFQSKTTNQSQDEGPNAVNQLVNVLLNVLLDEKQLSVYPS